MFSTGPHYDKLKTNLRLSINRMKLLQKKKTEQALKARKEIADFIQAGKADRARIRVEHIIREDYLVEVLEMLEMYCDLLLARFGVIQNMREMDPALEEPVCTLVWAAPRLFTDVQELKPVAEQLTTKYTKKYVESCCRSDECCKANPKVRAKLSVAAPPPALVEHYLIEIAKTYNVPYEPDQRLLSQENSHDGCLIDLGGVPAPMNAAQFGAAVGGLPQFPTGAGPSVAYPPGAFAGMPPQPPPYSAKVDPFADEKAQPNSAYDSVAPGPGPTIGWAGPAHPNAAPPSGYAYGYPPPASAPAPPPNNPQNPQFADQASAPRMSFNQADASGSTGAPQQPAATNSASIGFVLPDVPSSISPLPTNDTAASGSNDVDFDELQRRFDELKKKK